MHEYEFRLVVEDSASFLPLMQRLPHPYQVQVVYYLKPHFRFRHGTFETKRVESTRAVYHDGLWFRWVHSVETPYASWSRATYLSFLHNLGNYQDPLTVETRYVMAIDARAQLYTFRNGVGAFRLVFEWEHGTFARPQTRLDARPLLDALKTYRPFYGLMRHYRSPAFQLSEHMTRRPVATIDAVPETTTGGEQQKYVYAHKLDGVFGLVYSYRDKIKEKWEGYECVVRKNVSLGDGLVFAAERLDGGQVYLLDVYQVRGHDTIQWCRRDILLDFLANLDVAGVDGYHVQKYVCQVEGLDANPTVKTDGIIIHDVVQDAIYKLKTHHSVDLVYDQGYFYLPSGRFKSLEKGLEDGCVYEISTKEGRVMRKRTDRFKGNTAVQLENVLKHGWHGPSIEPLPGPLGKNKKCKKS